MVVRDFPKNARKVGSLWQLLNGIVESGLKDDALLFLLYELIGKQYKAAGNYAIYVFHDTYDIPLKGTDNVRQWESEEIYDYIIVAICPLKGEYQAGLPKAGFLYPSFHDRSCNQGHIAIYSKAGETDFVMGCEA